MYIVYICVTQFYVKRLNWLSVFTTPFTNHTKRSTHQNEFAFSRLQTFAHVFQYVNGPSYTKDYTYVPSSSEMANLKSSLSTDKQQPAVGGRSGTGNVLSTPSH